MQCKNRRCRSELPENTLYCPMCGRKQTVQHRRGKRPHGTGTVYLLQGKRARPWVASKSGLIIGYYATKAAALEALERLTDRTLSEKFNMTFAQVYDEWKAEHFPELSDQGKEGYVNAYAHFKPIHDTRFRDLRTKDFQQFIDRIINSGKSSSLANKLKQLIGQMYKWAMREEIITMSYAQFIKIPETPTKEKSIFTDDEIASLTKDGSDEAKIVLMMIYTGVRIGEMFGLKLSDYHSTFCVGGEKTEAGRNRVIPIPEPARPMFEYFAGKASVLLLDGFEGNKIPANFRRREYAELMKRLGITDKSPHCTRHTYISRAVNSGVRPELLQKIVGHASYSTTADIYYHSDTDELVTAANAAWSPKAP